MWHFQMRRGLSPLLDWPIVGCCILGTALGFCREFGHKTNMKENATKRWEKLNSNLLP